MGKTGYKSKGTHVLNSPPPQTIPAPLPTVENYQPDKYKIITGLSIPGRKGIVQMKIWPHYPFDRLPVGAAAFIPQTDPNSDIQRIQEAIKQFQREPQAVIKEGTTEGELKEFKAATGFDQSTSPPTPGTYLFRKK